MLIKRRSIYIIYLIVTIEEEQFLCQQVWQQKVIVAEHKWLVVVAAILKSGLRIMPHRGRKDIYFASENSKSACNGKKLIISLMYIWTLLYNT